MLKYLYCVLEASFTILLFVFYSCNCLQPVVFPFNVTFVKFLWDTFSLLSASPHPHAVLEPITFRVLNENGLNTFHFH